MSPVLTQTRDAGCRTEAAPPALHPQGVAASAAPPPDTQHSSSTSSSPTTLPSLSRSDPGTGGGGGGLQSRSNSSERLLEATSGTSEDYHDADGTRRARAVENQYSFYWGTWCSAVCFYGENLITFVFFKIRSRPITWEISTVKTVVSILVIRLWFLFSGLFLLWSFGPRDPREQTMDTTPRDPLPLCPELSRRPPQRQHLYSDHSSNSAH